MNDGHSFLQARVSLNPTLPGAFIPAQISNTLSFDIIFAKHLHV
jgi:hypothetical protein